MLTLQGLRSMSTEKALEAAHKLDAAARRKLWEECPASDHRTLLVLNVQDRLSMDDGFSGGISGISSTSRTTKTSGDYGAVRTFLLKRIQKATPAQRKAARSDVWTRWFFPEYRRISDIRERFVTIALHHSNMDYAHPMQRALFSLNGYFGWDDALRSAKTKTTCGLFVRAVRAAARILEPREWPTNTPRGTDPCIVGPTSAGSVDHKKSTDRFPKRGDIFHINSDGKTDAHVGIIVSHRVDEEGNWIWSTVEAGQGNGLETRFFESKKLVWKGGRVWMGSRPLVKWIDLNELAGSIHPSA